MVQPFGIQGGARRTVMRALHPALARALRKEPPRSPPRRLWKRVSRAIGDVLPKGLYARSLIIIIAPMVLLQSVIAYTFMERHWQLVTRRLSAAVTADPERSIRPPAPEVIVAS